MKYIFIILTSIFVHSLSNCSYKPKLVDAMFQGKHTKVTKAHDECPRYLAGKLVKTSAPKSYPIRHIQYDDPTYKLPDAEYPFPNFGISGVNGIMATVNKFQASNDPEHDIDGTVLMYIASIERAGNTFTVSYSARPRGTCTQGCHNFRHLVEVATYIKVKDHHPDNESNYKWIQTDKTKKDELWHKYYDRRIIRYNLMSTLMRIPLGILAHHYRSKYPGLGESQK